MPTNGSAKPQLSRGRARLYARGLLNRTSYDEQFEVLTQPFPELASPSVPPWQPTFVDRVPQVPPFTGVMVTETQLPLSSQQTLPQSQRVFAVDLL
jgi:hypothetical protein